MWCVWWNWRSRLCRRSCKQLQRPRLRDDGSCLYATTFNVDMNCPFNPGALLNGSTEINDLFVTGPLLGWAANEGYNQLTDEDGDNIFSVTLDFPAGDIEYKYAVNGFADQENLIDDMQNGADCAPVTDYAGYANRLVAAGSSTNDIFGSCTICSEQVVDVTFSVDVSNESFDYVTIAGTFNGWNNGANPMNDDDGDGIYTITLQFPPNSAQEYKFLGNGNWGTAEVFDGSESCTTGPGEYINRVVQVPGESIVLDTVCYNLCEACAPGCTNDTACNYDDSANVDNGTCEYVAATELPNCGDDAGEGAELGLFFSGYAEGSSNNKFMEIYNPTGDVVSLDGYAFPNVSNAPNVPGEYEYWNAFPAGASIAPGDVYVIAHPSADPAILAEADHTFTFLSNGDDGFILVMGSEEDFVQIDAIGDWNGDPGSGWPVAGVNNGTKDHSLIRKSDVTSGNGGDWVASAGTNEEDSEWIVLDQNDWTGLGSHDFAGAGGPTFAVIYDCDGNCLNDSNGDGLCDELTVMGCTDAEACNYDDCANLDDGLCEYEDAFCDDWLWSRYCVGLMAVFSMNSPSPTATATACAAPTERVDTALWSTETPSPLVATLQMLQKSGSALQKRLCSNHPGCRQLPKRTVLEHDRNIPGRNLGSSRLGRRQLCHLLPRWMLAWLYRC